MKNLSWFNKAIFFLNIVLTVLTFIGYVLPFLAPKLFPFLSVLTLVLPLFIIFNVVFFIYWAIQFKKEIYLSALVLLAGITFINKFYKFSEKNLPKSEYDFTVMSYNVRLFNLFEWINTKDVPQKIQSFINKQNPDILCIQEFSSSSDKIDLRVYKYEYILKLGNKIKTAQAIFSKFPIVNSGDILFPNSNNNAIFADIKKGNDTIRIYNIHLESLKISPDVTEINNDVNEIDQSKTEKITKQISRAFEAQQIQSDLIKAHKESCKYPILICGDMNNSAYSYVYRNIRGKLNDAFEEAGQYFGQTFNFKYYPARIDYIFVDKKIKVKSFSNFSEIKLSDHSPIMTRLEVVE